MAIAGRWIGIISDVLMVVAIILAAFTLFGADELFGGFGLILAMGAILFALIGGTLSLIALVSPNTAQTLHGRRDAAIGFASSSGAFLLCCVLGFMIAQMGS
jgi:serine/threonine-protein kinase